MIFPSLFPALFVWFRLQNCLPYKAGHLLLIPPRRVENKRSEVSHSHRFTVWTKLRISWFYFFVCCPTQVKRIFAIRFATCRIIRDPPASGSFLMIFHNRVAASQLIRSGLYHSWYKQVPIHCLLLRATSQGTCLTRLKSHTSVSYKSYQNLFRFHIFSIYDMEAVATGWPGQKFWL